MYPSLPNVADLEAVLEVSRGGSISAAARSAGANQQTMSARIARAEKILGLRIFVRTPYGVHLTDAGREIVSALPDMLSACRAFAARAAQLRGDSAQRRLTVAVSNTVAEVYYPTWAASFHRSHPAVQLTMLQANSRDVRSMVADAAVDLGIVEGGSVRHDLVEQVIGRDELVLAVPTGHPWADANVGVISRAQLRATPLVVREPGSGSRRVIEDALGQLAPPAGEFGSLSSQRTGMLALQAPAILPRGAVADQVELGRIAIVKTSLRFVRDISAVTRRGDHPTPDAVELVRVATATLMSRLGSRD